MNSDQDIKIARTAELSFQIEKMFKESKDFLIVVSPYIHLHNNLKTLLKELTDNEVNIIVLYRLPDEKSKSIYFGNKKNEDINFIKALKKIKIIPINNLHAKCYINETKAILTSLNLWEYSQINNFELGAIFLRNHNQYQEILKEIELIIKLSTDDFDLSIIKETLGFWTMGKLASEIVFKYYRKQMSIKDDEYSKLCSFAKSIHKFKPGELYQDGTNILRSTTLKRQDYLKLYNQLSNHIQKIFT